MTRFVPRHREVRVRFADEFDVTESGERVAMWLAIGAHWRDVLFLCLLDSPSVTEAAVYA